MKRRLTALINGSALSAGTGTVAATNNLASLLAARDIIAADAKDGEIDMTYRIDVEDTSQRIVHSEFEDAVSIKRAT